MGGDRHIGPYIAVDQLADDLGMHPVRQGAWRGRCPVHQGTSDTSLSLKEGEGGKPLLHCFGGCAADAVIATIGCTFADLHVGHVGTAARIVSGPHRASGGSDKPGPIIAEYVYRDADGSVRLRVTKHTPKTFRPWHVNATGGWVLGMGRIRPMIYRLPEVMAADPAVPVLMVEGEKDADALAALGFVATTNIGGAGKWRPEYTEALRGRHVVIIPDADDPGHRHAEQVAAAVFGNAASVKVIEL